MTVCNRIVKYEVSVRIEGDGCVLGMPEVVCESIRDAIKRSEKENSLYAAIGVAAILESVEMIGTFPLTSKPSCGIL